jgi:diguanylate cyclase (GGDEF)-like protein
MPQKTSTKVLQFWRRPGGIIAALALLSLFVYIVWIFFFPFNPGEEEVISSLGLALYSLLAAVFGIYIYFRKDFDHRLRRGWLLLALAAASNFIAELFWLYYKDILGVDPFPSIADFFYLLFYPLTLVGVLLFPFAPLVQRERTIMWLDLGIVMLASCMVFWYFILAPLQLSVEQGLAGIIALAYPVGDLLIFAGVVSLIQRDLEKLAHGSMILLGAGIVFTTFADVLFAYFEINAIPYAITLLNLLFLGGMLCQLLAAIWQLSTRPEGQGSSPVIVDRSKRLFRLALPYLAAGVGPILLVIVVNSTLVSGPRLRGLLFGTVAMVILVLLRQYAVLVENIRLYEQMQRLAIRDTLTGVYNRHFFNETFRREIDRAARFEKPLSVLLMDVDKFKMFNDTYGHLQGDIVLQTISKQLASQLRQGDILARFGGDEFVVILPETNLENANLVAKNMKQTVAAQSFAGQPLGVSVGAATFCQGVSPERFLEEADEALYRDKSLTRK